MNLARGRELGIADKVGQMTYRLSNPPREWYEGERVGGGEVTSCSGESHDILPGSPRPRGALDLANWMGDLAEHIADLPLHKIRLPGTHDSGAYRLSRTRMGDLPRWLRGLAGATRGVATRPVTGIIAGWGEAQALDIYGQLTAGARYLDLRVVHERGRYFTEHGMAGASFESIFAQIDAFLENHPREVVVCDFNHFHRFETAEDHHGFLDLLERTIGLHVAPLALRRASDSGGTVTHRELLRAGRRCVCLYGGWDHRGVARKAVEVGCWGRKLHDLWSPWPMASSRRSLVARLRALDIDGTHAAGFFVLQGVVTPDAARIAKSLVLPDRGRPRTLKALAHKVTPMVCDMVTRGDLRARCIVMLDHIDVADVEGMLLSAYGRKLEAPARRLGFLEDVQEEEGSEEVAASSGVKVDYGRGGDGVASLGVGYARGRDSQVA